MNTIKRMVASFGLMLVSLPAFAEEAVASAGGDTSSLGLIAIGAGIGIGLAALGGGLGQGKAASAALDGIARNPSASGKLFVPMLLSLAFMESLVIFTWLVASGLAGNVGKVLTGQ